MSNWFAKLVPQGLSSSAGLRAKVRSPNQMFDEGFVGQTQGLRRRGSLSLGLEASRQNIPIFLTLTIKSSFLQAPLRLWSRPLNSMHAKDRASEP